MKHHVNKIIKIIILFISIITIFLIPIIFYFLFRKFGGNLSNSILQYLTFLGTYLSAVIGLMGIICTIYFSFKNTRMQLSKTQQNSIDASIYLYIYKKTETSLDKINCINGDLVSIAATSKAIANNIKLNPSNSKNKRRNSRDLTHLKDKLNYFLPQMNKYFKAESANFSCRSRSLATMRIRDHKKIRHFSDVVDIEAKLSNTYSVLLLNSYYGLVYDDNDVHYVHYLLDIAHNSYKAMNIITRRLVPSIVIFLNIYIISKGLEKEKKK